MTALNWAPTVDSVWPSLATTAALIVALATAVNSMSCAVEMLILSRLISVFVKALL